MLTRILDDEDSDDPILSVVNIIDVFLVIIAGLLIAILENPLNPFAAQDMVVIRNPDTPQMEMIVRKGEEMKHYKSTGEIGQGEGVRAGVAYRLKDGSMIYIPEETDKATGTSSK
ncbi:MAG TPA: DUF2149 domain-containing protein [Nitrosomonas sp.]|nr:DUF2149 domain-containing protein [Nitrosomonas sp.]